MSRCGTKIEGEEKMKMNNEEKFVEKNEAYGSCWCAIGANTNDLIEQMVEVN